MSQNIVKKAIDRWHSNKWNSVDYEFALLMLQRKLKKFRYNVYILNSAALKLQHGIFKHKLKSIDTASPIEFNEVFSENASNQPNLVTFDQNIDIPSEIKLVTPIADQPNPIELPNTVQKDFNSLQKPINKIDTQSHSSHTHKRTNLAIFEPRMTTLQTPILKSSRKVKPTK